MHAASGLDTLIADATSMSALSLLAFAYLVWPLYTDRHVHFPALTFIWDTKTTSCSLHLNLHLVYSTSNDKTLQFLFLLTELHADSLCFCQQLMSPQSNASAVQLLGVSLAFKMSENNKRVEHQKENKLMWNTKYLFFFLLSTLEDFHKFLNIQGWYCTNTVKAERVANVTLLFRKL